jgi:hypothetical protein
MMSLPPKVLLDHWKAPRNITSWRNRWAGPLESTAEHHLLAKQMGFSYRQVLGEIMYACVVCRVDIGSAITTLARFSLAPAAEHYTLRQFLTCLRYRLPGYVDASHAPDPTTWHSITGVGFSFVGGVVAYTSNNATNGRDFQYQGRVHRWRDCRHDCQVPLFCSFQLGVSSIRTYRSFLVNQAAIAMVNANRPTPALVILTFTTWQFKNGDVMASYIFSTSPASSTRPTLVPNCWPLHFIIAMHVDSWITTVAALRLLSKRSESGRIMTVHCVRCLTSIGSLKSGRLSVHCMCE